MARFPVSVFAWFALLVGAGSLSGGCGSREEAEVRTSLSVSALLGEAPDA
jgi:hypothetical protein